MLGGISVFLGVLLDPRHFCEAKRGLPFTSKQLKTRGKGPRFSKEIQTA